MEQWQAQVQDEKDSSQRTGRRLEEICMQEDEGKVRVAYFYML